MTTHSNLVSLSSSIAAGTVHSVITLQTPDKTGPGKIPKPLNV